MFLAQVESFSMLRSCITNLHSFQHGRPGYLEALQKTSVVLINSYFLDFENENIRKRMSVFRMTLVNPFRKYSTSIPFPEVGQFPYLYRHQLEIQSDYVISS